ncbi:putative F-box/FBD/LRR-repeat protein [Carex littledalei]|uniref:Putative F-box/FBD/LRR-repeat protein n=1 Tax=Carex littledalei TaxID=544730 RepID=A0A833QK82_9POAL|nr:putative F-box/FBD/LRR-repeat protein [Carex littledalei]
MAQSVSESSSSQDNRDMLSNLPDPVLHHIMSFMPAMQAVQLCVLSKRWKTLWTTLPVLNFGFWELRNNQLNHSTLNRVKRLAEFVSMVLLLRETTSQLHTFTLDCGSEYSGYVRTGDVLRTSIRPWIRYAIKCNLRVLTIIWMDKKILLPSEVFTCPSLEYVTLGRIGTPEVINLPSLKQLHLKYSVLDQDFMSKLLCGCPVLEDLHVEGGLVEFSKITSHSLKHLKITSHDCHWKLAELSEMIINAPNLLSFHFEMCSFCQEGIMLNMPSLHEACIKFICSDELVSSLDMTKSNILCGLINVHRLKLNGYLSSACWYAEIANCRTFSNLTCLSVGSCMNFCQFNLFSSLLEHCPNLRNLSLGPDYEFRAEQIDEVARFKCEQLETVEVKFYLWDTNFHWVVKCLQEAVTELPNCRIIMTSTAD